MGQHVSNLATSNMIEVFSTNTERKLAMNKENVQYLYMHVNKAHECKQISKLNIFSFSFL